MLKISRALPKRLHPVCQSMPTILYGSVKEQDHDIHQHQALLKIKNQHSVPFRWDHFETTQWHYHAAWRDYRNGFQKVIMDLSLIGSRGSGEPQHRGIVTQPYAYNPHQPSNTSCSRMTLFPETSAIKKYPLTLNHYVGSFERYISRKQDNRRRREVRTDTTDVCS